MDCSGLSTGRLVTILTTRGIGIFLAKAKDFDKFERLGIKGLRLP
jgi:hypothetical protein